MSGLSYYLERLLNVLVVLMAIVFSGLVLFQIVARYGFGISIFFASAVSNYVFIWFAMLGAALATKDGLHAAIELLPRYLPRKSQRFVRAAAHLFSLMFVCILIYASVWALPAAQRNINPALGISVAWGIAAIPVGSLFVAFFVIDGLRKLFRYTASIDSEVR